MTDNIQRDLEYLVSEHERVHVRVDIARSR